MSRNNNAAKKGPNQKDYESVYEALKNGVSWAQIRKNLRIGQNVIQKVRKQMLNNEPIIAPQMKRKTKDTPEVVRKVKDKTFSHPTMSCSKLSKKLNSEVSSSSVHRIRKNVGFRFMQKQYRTPITKAQRMKRLKFCKVNIKTDALKVLKEKTLISDESRFCLVPDRRRCWRLKSITSKSISAPNQNLENL